MRVTKKQDQKKAFYNICIVDNSTIYSLGLKNSIERSLSKTVKTFVFFHQSIEDINPFDITPIDVLFLDYNDLFNPHFNSIFSKIIKNNPDVKLIVSTNDYLQVDFIKLYSYKINGLFSKSLNYKSFSVYFKRVLEKSMYIDYHSISHVIEQEKKQKIKHYYKSVSLQNLELIQHRYVNYTPYMVDKDILPLLNINNI